MVNQQFLNYSQTETQNIPATKIHADEYILYNYTK